VTGWIESLPDGAGLQPDGGFVLPLRQPVQIGQREITELRFRPPKGKDYRNVPLNVESQPMDVMFKFGAKLCGEIPQVIDELSSVDATRFLEVASGFFNATPAGIGTSPSGSSHESSAGVPGTSTS
jgi:hypothetical protein